MVLTAEGKTESSSAVSAVSFYIHAVDKATAEKVKEKLTKKAKDLIETVEIQEDGIKRLGRHLISKIKSLGTSDVAVEIGMYADCK